MPCLATLPAISRPAGFAVAFDPRSLPWPFPLPSLPSFFPFEPSLPPPFHLLSYHLSTRPCLFPQGLHLHLPPDDPNSCHHSAANSHASSAAPTSNEVGLQSSSWIVTDALLASSKASSSLKRCGCTACSCAADTKASPLFLLVGLKVSRSCLQAS